VAPVRLGAFGEKVIEAKGRLNPPPIFLRAVSRVADESFGRSVSGDLISNMPEINGWMPAPETNVCLRTKNVHPHEDTFVGDGSRKNWRNVFWLLDGDLWIQVAKAAQHMRSGDWVLFDDRTMHCVIADCKWTGIAVQYVKGKK
jgi:hypothetical protein